jgi:hypothetical protein
MTQSKKLSLHRTLSSYKQPVFEPSKSFNQACHEDLKAILDSERRFRYGALAKAKEEDVARQFSQKRRPQPQPNAPNIIVRGGDVSPSLFPSLFGEDGIATPQVPSPLGWAWSAPYDTGSLSMVKKDDERDYNRSVSLGDSDLGLLSVAAGGGKFFWFDQFEVLSDQFSGVNIGFDYSTPSVSDYNKAEAYVMKFFELPNQAVTNPIFPFAKSLRQTLSVVAYVLCPQDDFTT